MFVRVERLAATLPPADADILRGEIQANRAAIESTQAAYHSAQDSIHDVLRQDPFDAEALRAAMAKTRAARLTSDQTIQGIFAAIAAKISTGRQTGLGQSAAGTSSPPATNGSSIDATESPLAGF